MKDKNPHNKNPKIFSGISDGTTLLNPIFSKTGLITYHGPDLVFGFGLPMSPLFKENLIETKSFEFSLNIIALYKKLVEENEYVISKQILRSGTSIGANIQEASAAFSKKDFLYKMSISSKEARETKYWLQLL